jgi:hypothetical protein
MASVRSATSSCRHSTRSAEQRWPALSKAEAMTSPTTCSASAEESTIMPFCPPVSAISGIGLPDARSRSAELRLDQPGDLGRAGEHDARGLRRADKRRPRLARRLEQTARRRAARRPHAES